MLFKFGKFSCYWWDADILGNYYGTSCGKDLRNATMLEF